MPKRYRPKKGRKFAKKYRKTFGKKAYKKNKKLIKKVINSMTERKKIFYYLAGNDPSLNQALTPAQILTMTGFFIANWALDPGLSSARTLQPIPNPTKVSSTPSIIFAPTSLKVGNGSAAKTAWDANDTVPILMGLEYKRQSLVIDITMAYVTRQWSQTAQGAFNTWFAPDIGAGPVGHFTTNIGTQGNSYAGTNLRAMRYEFIIYQALNDVTDASAVGFMQNYAVLEPNQTYPQTSVHVLHREFGMLNATKPKHQHKIVLKGKYFRRKFTHRVDPSDNEPYAIEQGRIFMRMIYEYQNVESSIANQFNLSYPVIERASMVYKFQDIN